MADETGTLGLIAVRDEEKLMLAHTWRPHGAASIWLEVGHRIPIIGSSSGAGFLAALNESEFAHISSVLEKAQKGEGSKAGAELQRARNQYLSCGFVYSIANWTPTVTAVSVPFRSREFGEPIVLSFGALPETLTEDRIINEVGPKLKSLVRELEQAMGLPPTMVDLV